MDQFYVKLLLLLDISTKKRDTLEIILNLSENQNCVAKSSLNDESRALFMALATEKQKHIDEVYAMDTAFQRTYDAIKDGFKQDLDQETREKLVSLQDTINDIIALDNNICSIESENNDLLEKKKLEVQKIDIPKGDRNKVIEHYKKQSSNYNKLKS